MTDPTAEESVDGTAEVADGEAVDTRRAVLDEFGAAFEGAVRASDVLLGEPTAILDKERTVEAMRWLRDEAGFQLLRSVTCVDFLGDDQRFHVVYHLAALPESMVNGDPDPAAGELRTIRIKVPVSAASPVIDSVTDVYPTADWHEREVWDLFGVDFAGHPDLRRILLPEDHEGHPLRKDAPIQYEAVQFSFNYDAVAAAKPRARE